MITSENNRVRKQLDSVRDAIEGAGAGDGAGELGDEGGGDEGELGALGIPLLVGVESSSILPCFEGSVGRSKSSKVKLPIVALKNIFKEIKKIEKRTC